MKTGYIIKPNKKEYEIFSREYFVEMGRKGGAAGRGKAKKRKTSFDSKTGKAAIEKRWKNK